MANDFAINAMKDVTAAKSGPIPQQGRPRTDASDNKTSTQSVPLSTRQHAASMLQQPGSTRNAG